MRIAVTGASGFVGLNLVRELDARGHDVIAIDRSFPPTVRPLLPRTAVVVEADIRSRKSLEDAFAGARVDALFAFAAITADRAREESAFSEVLDVNVTGTARSLEAALHAGIERIFVASSSAVYGDAVFDESQDEDCATEPATLYGIAKLGAEKAALRFGTIHGLAVTALRIAAVFGPWERRTGVRAHMSPLYQIAENAHRGKPVSLPEGGDRDWIDARRIGKISCHMLERDRLRKRVYNVAAARVWSPELFCCQLREDMNALTWRSGDPLPSIDYNDDLSRHRHALSTKRLRAEFGDEAIGDPNRDIAEFARWVTDNPQWFLTQD